MYWPMSFPAATRAKLRSANPLERVNGEMKRRADIVTSRNEYAIPRLVGATLLEQNDEWSSVATTQAGLICISKKLHQIKNDPSDEKAE